MAGKTSGRRRGRSARLATMLGCVAAIGSGTAVAQDQPAEGQDPFVIELPTIDIQGSQVELTLPYVGGQVATGSRAGLLGNLDFLEMPFSSTAYTQELIQNQQADSIGDVLLNDPTVRVAKGFGNFQEVYVIRGFPVYSDDMTLNGLYGILPRQFVAAELMERVEVFRGANAFINGAAPGDSAVGGTINLVPKRAPAEGINSLTLGYESNGQFVGSADVGRRYGANGEWGIRASAHGRVGESAVEDEDRSLTALSLGVDYAGTRARFSFDLGYQDNRIDAPRPQVTPPFAGDVPEPPDADTNYAQPWTYSDEEQVFGVVRGEFDITENVTAWVAGGARFGEEANVLANPSTTSTGVTSAYRFDNTREDTVLSGDAGIRAEFDTGIVGHRVVFSVSGYQEESDNAYAFSSFAGFAGDLYNPFPVPPPAANFFVGGVLSDPLKTSETTTASVAFADTLSFLDGRLKTTFGLRYQYLGAETYDYNTGARISNYDDSKVTPAFGVTYELVPGLALYANYAQALQRGETAPTVNNGRPVLNAGEILAPYVSDQVEVGAKYDAETFGGTLSLFSISKPRAIVENDVFSDGGEQQNQGVELTLFGEPVAGVRVIGGLTYVDTEVTTADANDGNAAIGTPEFQLNGNVEWDLPFIAGLTVDARLIHTGAQYVNAANTVEVDSWTRLDLGLRYVLTLQGVDWTLRGRVENLTDESYWASVGGFPGANYLVQGNPRTFIASLNVTF
ncbi:TonB-dependent receptor [Zavarzinia sp. CC-PAN008]|uniref:TonB-dependent receptor n=1 Tax=Zavarzinia sp. CC-PAN008 TaxID=3243332 RepID=UPI003F748C30